MNTAAHLAARFVRSLSRAAPPPADEAWARSVLLAGERRLWALMDHPDRRHAIGVARDVDAALGGAPRPVLAAALLHDAGKVLSGLGTPARVGATLVGLVAWRRAVARQRGPLRRVGLYLDHAERGAELLAAAGSDPITVAWAREHHLPPARWTLEPALAAALKAADDD